MTSLNFETNVPLSKLTTWRVGGSAQFFVNAVGSELPTIVEHCVSNRIEYSILGRGSNILINDLGVPGLVISTRNAMTQIFRDGDLVIAEAGVSLPALSKFIANLGYTGYEFLVGIPGTVGGGVAMNAGLTVYRPREIRDVVQWIELFTPDRGLEVVSCDDMEFGYRDSKILDSGSVVTRAAFRLLDKDDPRAIRQRSIEHHRDRKAKQPLKMPTAGSTFRSKIGDKSAGYYIEKAGLKGRRIGDARVSDIHANWIENLGKARSLDILELVELIEKAVADKFDVILEREFQTLGY